jgi:hypothetical protein
MISLLLCRHAAAARHPYITKCSCTALSKKQKLRFTKIEIFTSTRTQWETWFLCFSAITWLYINCHLKDLKNDTSGSVHCCLRNNAKPQRKYVYMFTKCGKRRGSIYWYSECEAGLCLDVSRAI